MKIEDLREKENEPTFSALAVGAVFKYAEPDGKDWTFMKIPDVIEASENDERMQFDDNAVCLEDGCLCWFDWDERVIKVEAKLVIEK
jgi:hypothetical protein